MAVLTWQFFFVVQTYIHWEHVCVGMIVFLKLNFMFTGLEVENLIKENVFIDWNTTFHYNLGIDLQVCFNTELWKAIAA